MANSFITQEQIVQAAVLLLQREVVLPRLVWTQPDAAFIGAKDDTITLRVPAVLSARTRTMRSDTALTADDLTETSVPVVLDTHVYSLLNIRDEELTLDITDFAAQVLAPQMRAVAEGMEDVIAGALAGANVAGGQQLTLDPDDPYGTLIDANTVLNTLNVPRGNRVLVAGANVEAAILKSDKFATVNQSGTSDALRDAVISRAAGFTIVGSNAVDPDIGYAMDQYAVAFADVAPSLPAGATMKSRVALAGLALRYLRDYNPTADNGPVDRSLVDAFVGASSVEQDGNNNRLVVITNAGS